MRDDAGSVSTSGALTAGTLSSAGTVTAAAFSGIGVLPVGAIVSVYMDVAGADDLARLHAIGFALCDGTTALSQVCSHLRLHSLLCSMLLTC
jgi:hypothetical protein